MQRLAFCPYRQYRIDGRFGQLTGEDLMNEPYITEDELIRHYVGFIKAWRKTINMYMPFGNAMVGFCKLQMNEVSRFVERIAEDEDLPKLAAKVAEIRGE